jgi:hypothetical protein
LRLPATVVTVTFLPAFFPRINHQGMYPAEA